MAFRIQIRRDTASKWKVNNPILLDGELGYETDTKYLKIGDSTTPWNELMYWQAGNSSVPNFTVTVLLDSGNISSIVTSKGPDGSILTNSPWNFVISNDVNTLTVTHNKGYKPIGLATYSTKSNNIIIKTPNNNSTSDFSVMCDLEYNSFSLYNINSENTGADSSGTVEISWMFGITNQ
jgi:hypothetical protein